LHPYSIKNKAIADAIRCHHVAVLLETRTNALDRLMFNENLHETHKLVHATQVPDTCLGRKGYGVAVIAANACADFLSVFHVSEDLQCVWLLCSKTLFGQEADVMLCAAYLNPASNQHCVSDLYSNFADELSCAAQVTENLVLCGDFNAHVGRLSEVSDVHGRMLAAVPALHEPRRVVRNSTNNAGRLLVDLAAVFQCVIATGRAPGDDGQHTCFKDKGSSRPDHIFLSSKLFQAVSNTSIDRSARSDQCDHCAISMCFNIDDTACTHVDLALKHKHVCKPGGCGSKLSLKWKPERAQIYAQVLLANSEIQDQFKQAIEAADVEKACFCVRSMVEHAASDRGVGMARHVSVCASLRPKRARNPPWFDAECMAKRRALLDAVRSGQAVHACQFLRKQFRLQTRRAKRAHTKYQKAVFLDRLYRKDPELHAMLRKPQRAQQTPLSAKAWEEYLGSHFKVPRDQPPGQGVAARARERVAARDMAVPLGRNHPSPEMLLNQGVERAWMPEPDVFSMPSVLAIEAVLEDIVKKMNVRASSGFDVVAAPFIKHATILQADENGRNVRVNVLLPYIAELFKLMMDKAYIPACWKHARLSPLYKKGPLLNPNSYRMLAVSGTMYRLYANVVRSIVNDWCVAEHKIPDTQFGFYPGRSTLHPMFILRHLRHAAHKMKPYNNSPRLYAAFIDFKQAYDTIPRAKLWQHLQRASMPTPLLSIIQNMYDKDAYILADGCKTARVCRDRGVKQGCPLSPLLFSLYINDLGI
jgi:exonuclease III